MTAEGEVETPLDEEAVRKATARLRSFGVTSIAVVLPLLVPESGPRAAAPGEIILDEYPDVEHDLARPTRCCPKPPEFERTSTTLVNAYVGPPIARYLDRLEERSARRGFTDELVVGNVGGRGCHPE